MQHYSIFLRLEAMFDGLSFLHTKFIIKNTKYQWQILQNDLDPRYIVELFKTTHIFLHNSKLQIHAAE